VFVALPFGWRFLHKLADLRRILAEKLKSIVTGLLRMKST
jgi:hypothetical protein